MTNRCQLVRDLLEELEDGELGPRRKALVMLHLESCAACRRAREEQSRALSATRSALAQHPRIAAPRGFDANVWQSIEARRRERERATTPLARLGLFLLRPMPRLFSSAMFGLLAALAFGHMAASVPVPASSQAPVALPAGAQDADVSLAALYAMEQRRFRPPAEPQVLAPDLTPQIPQATPERRSQENPLWPNPPRPSRAASSSDAGSWC